jgi:hypothetical protein
MRVSQPDLPSASDDSDGSESVSDKGLSQWGLAIAILQCEAFPMIRRP